MVGYSFLTKRRPLDLGKSTRRYTVQPRPSYPNTEHEAAVERTLNRISEMQFRYKNDDYIEFPCSISAEDVRTSLKALKTLLQVRMASTTHI